MITIILGNINNKYNLAIRLRVLKSHYGSLTRKGPKTLLLMAIVVQLQETLNVTLTRAGSESLRNCHVSHDR